MVDPHKGKSIKSKIILIAPFLILCLLTNSTQVVSAGSNSYGDDFSTTTYMDAGNTTAIGWGSGAIFSPNKSLELVASFDTGGNSRSIAIAGDLAYVADMANGLQIFDISDPTSLSLVGYYNATMHGSEDVFVDGDYVFVADNTYGLWVLNASVPSNPVVLDNYDTPGNPTDVFVDGNYAFLADAYVGGLQIINCTDVTDLSFTGSYDTGGASAAQGVFVDGDYAYQ